MRSSPSIPILMYHQVSPEALPGFRKYTVSPRAFAAQMSWLTLAGYMPVTLDAFLAGRAGSDDLPARPVLITFDDGFREACEYAVPILEDRGFTAVFFLVAGLVGGTSRWLRRERGLELPMIDWPAARRLEADGFQCASHSLTHPRLAELPPAECQRELRDSRRLLEDELGHEVIDLAYPHGSSGELVRSLARDAGYRSACSVRIDLARAHDEALDLPRVPVLGQDSLLDFMVRLRTAVSWAELRRRPLQALRLRLAGRRLD